MFLPNLEHIEKKTIKVWTSAGLISMTYFILAVVVGYSTELLDLNVIDGNVRSVIKITAL